MEKIIKFIQKNKGYIICFLIIILSVISIVFQDLDRKNTIKINNEEMAGESGKIGVYVTGAVKNPGVYYLDRNSRLYQLLDICGGIQENADISKLNLALKLNDSDKIDVPIKKEESSENSDFQEDIEENNKININEAGVEELKTLTGIGESTAKKIIDYRNKNKFESIEDIMNVPGIGESKFNNIKDDICVWYFEYAILVIKITHIK